VRIALAGVRRIIRTAAEWVDRPDALVQIQMAASSTGC
jgi:hypothetical protein